MEEDTMEIDPKQLSDETLKELEDDLDIDTEFAKDKAKEIHLNNISLDEPNNISSLTQISNYINSKFEKIADILSLESISGEIKDVIPKEDQIIIKVKNPNKEYAKIYMNKDSKVLSNLVRHKNVNKISELIGESIMCKNIGNKKYVIPKYISLLSELRFKIYYILSNISRNIEKIADISKNKIDPFEFLVSIIIFINIIPVFLSSGSMIYNLIFISAGLILLFGLTPFISLIVKIIRDKSEGSVYTMEGSDLE